MVARELSQQYQVPDPDVQNDERGAPIPIAGYEWSVSHKGDWIAVAISTNPIGVDLEVRMPVTTARFALIDASEWGVMGDQSDDHFYQLWTAKEAIIKQKKLSLDDHALITIQRRDENQLLMAYHQAYTLVQTVVTADYIYAYTL